MNVLSFFLSQKHASKRRKWKKRPIKRKSQSLLHRPIVPKCLPLATQNVRLEFLVCCELLSIHLSCLYYLRTDLNDTSGPTSPFHMLHSQATINPRVYESYDQRYHHSFEVSKSGDGLILVQKPANDDQKSFPPNPSDLHIERDIIEKLVNAYFAEVAPLLPVVTEAEFLAYSNPPSILIYSMCLIAAARRDVPQNVFDSIRYIVNSILKADDVLSTASIVNVQSLLILCMTGDCHSKFVPNAISALWIRLGAAIRMVS